MDYYFIQDDGGMFKSTISYEPYFYIATRVRLFPFRYFLKRKLTTCLIVCQAGQEGQVEEWLTRKYEDFITKLKRVRKEDLKLVRRKSLLRFSTI